MARRERLANRLLDHWVPPDGAGEAVGCVATTFTFDSVFFEEECLTRFAQVESDPQEDGPAYLIEREEKLAGLACAAVLVDQHHCKGSRSLRWDLVPVRVAGGIMHAKVSLLVWTRLLRLIVASANLTPARYRTNQEIFGVLEHVPGSGPAPAWLAATVGFLRAVLEVAAAEGAPDVARVRGLLARVEESTAGAPTDQEAAAEEGPEVTAVYLQPGSESVLDQLRRLWPGGPIGAAEVTSPFYDDPGSPNEPARRLWGMLRQRGEAEVTWYAPGQKLEDGESALLYAPVDELEAAAPQSRPGVSTRYMLATKQGLERDGGTDAFRPLHIKSLILSEDDRALVMMGSSNFTTAGLGIGEHARNIEANLAYLISKRRHEREWRAIDAILPEAEEIPGDKVRGEAASDIEGENRADDPGLPAFLGRAVYDAGASGPFVIRLPGGRYFPLGRPRQGRLVPGSTGEWCAGCCCSGRFTMKVVMLIAIAAVVASNVCADDGAGFRYMPIENYSRGASITVAGVQDFLVRAREQKVDTLYVEVIKGSGSRQQTTHVVFVSAGVFYVLDAHNYQTVPDLLRGDKLGFADGLEYYDAMGRGFSDKAEYDREAGRGFLTKADRDDADKNGFLEPPTHIEMIPYPRTVPVTMFEELLARAYFWRWIESGAAVRRDGPAFGPLSAGGWLEPEAARGMASGNPPVPIRTGLSPLEKERLVKVVVDVWIRATAGGSAAASSRAPRGDPLEVDDPPYVKEGDNYLFKGRQRVFPSLPGQNSGRPQGLLFVGSAPPTGDAILYYFAKANACRTFADLVTLSDAVAKGFESAEDAAKASSRGFRSAGDYYDALRAGFGQSADYELANRLSVRKYEEYAPIKATLDSLRAVSSRYGTRSLRDAAVVLLLERIESGRTVSLQRVADDVNSLVRQNEALKRIDASFGVVTPEGVRAFLDANGGSILTIGTFSSQDLVFRRN